MNLFEVTDQRFLLQTRYLKFLILSIKTYMNFILSLNISMITGSSQIYEFDLLSLKGILTELRSSMNYLSPLVIDFQFI